MTQAPPKESYVVETVSCSHCQQESAVHINVGGGSWSTAHHSVKCMKCKREFEAVVPSAVIVAPFLPR
jgi:hypothetical protein